MPTDRPREFAIVTGGSSGIGLEFVKLLARDGCDMLIVADEPLHVAADQARRLGAGSVETLMADLGTDIGMQGLLDRIAGRGVDVLIANAAEGQRARFVEQDWAEVRHIIMTNVVATTWLVHHVARQMVANGRGRILVTGSIVADMPGPLNLIYNASKAYVVNFCAGLSEELVAGEVTLTCLLPGPVDTPFFAKADAEATVIANLPKYTPARVARDGYAAMRRGDRKVISGLLSKLQYRMAGLLPDVAVAKLHRVMFARAGK